jgi:hypothetical protein
VPDALNTDGFTRRRALALGAAGGMSGLLVWSGAAEAAGRLPSVRAAGLALPRGAVPAGGRAGTVIRTAQPFDLVGLRGVDLRGAGAELRVRRRGRPWSPWVPLGAGADHAPDRPKAAAASDPVWAGGADELQLRARRAVHGGRLQLITAPAVSGHAEARAAARAATPRAGGLPPIIPRSAWGAEKVPPRAEPSYGAVQLAFVHHTVSANAYRPEDSPRIVLSIAKYHRDSNGWNDIGYNFLVDMYGQVFEGRAGGIDQAVIGAQAGGWNSQSTGIATIGDFDKTTLPEPAVAVLSRLIAWKLSLHGAPTSGTVSLVSGGGRENRYPYGQQVTLERVSGHRDGCSTDCPGDLLYGQLDELRRRVAAIGPIAVTSASASATLRADATRVRFGEDAVLRGQVLRADGAPAADVPVSIQKRTSTGGWARVAGARTATDGTYEARVSWKREAGLRAQAQLAPGTAGRVRSSVVAVGLDVVVSVLAPGESSRVQAGHSVAVRGSIGPSGPVRIVIERQVPSGRWVPAGRVGARVSKTTFAATVPLQKPALYRLTAVAGTAKAPVSAPPIFVRAVRRASSVSGSQGGASASVAPPPGTAGGVAAP